MLPKSWTLPIGKTIRSNAGIGYHIQPLTFYDFDALTSKFLGTSMVRVPGQGANRVWGRGTVRLRLEEGIDDSEPLRPGCTDDENNLARGHCGR